MIYKIQLKHSQSPFWYFKPDADSGFYEMYTDKGSSANLWVKREMFDYQVEVGNYIVLSITEDE